MAINDIGDPTARYNSKQAVSQDTSRLTVGVLLYCPMIVPTGVFACICWGPKTCCSTAQPMKQTTRSLKSSPELRWEMWGRRKANALMGSQNLHVSPTNLSLEFQNAFVTIASFSRRCPFTRFQEAGRNINMAQCLWEMQQHSAH